jgi:hypothetical protein
MRRTTILVLIGQFLGAVLMMSVVNAQTGVGTNRYRYAISAGIASSSSAIIISPGMPIAPPIDSGFIQFNNLTIESVSGTNPPAEILASNPNIYPLMGISGAAVSSITPSAASSVMCYKFNAQNSTTSKAISCPTPKTAPSVTASTTQSIPSSSASGNTASSMIYPPTYPIRYQPYRIEIDAFTHLLLRDRTSAALDDFSSGDQINVFGYYNSDGSVQAYLVRDLSKPTQDEFLQLNNVELVSISANAIPATLVVTQTQGYPCYGFGTDGMAKKSIACPMGIQATTNNPALQNLSVPAALAPNWQLLRKYVINVDAQTVILDNNRTNLSLSDLQVGDQLNVYGDTTDSGQTLNADIVRDLSIPATPSTYSGKVTQVNIDGSFVIQTNDGRAVTVQNPLQVGATVQLTGLLDRLKNVLTRVSNINFNENSVTMPSLPTTPGMLRIQGSGSLPAGSGGIPNTKN